MNPEAEIEIRDTEHFFSRLDRFQAAGEQHAAERNPYWKANGRAMTKPSPPLLPGPANTSTERRVQRFLISRTTPSPAASINSILGTPPFTVLALSLIHI